MLRRRFLSSATSVLVLAMLCDEIACVIEVSAVGSEAAAAFVAGSVIVLRSGVDGNRVSGAGYAGSFFGSGHG